MNIKTIPLKIQMVVKVLVWFSGVLVVLLTILNQYALYRPMPPQPIVPERALPAERPVAEELAEIVRRRVGALQNGAADVLARKDESGMPPGTLLNRPALALRGVAVAAGSRVAVIASSGKNQTTIVREGDEIEGVQIVRIGDDEALCRWRGQEFYLALR